jgi:hypothetical protein
MNEVRVSRENRILAGASHFSATNDYRNTAKIKKTIVIPDAGFSARSRARDATIQPLFQLS